VATEGTWSVTSDAEQVRVVLRGQFDAYNVPAVTAELAQLIRPGRRIEIDVAAVTFLDSSALSALVAVHQDSAQAGCTFGLTSVPPTVRRLLEITGLDDHLLL